MLRIGKYLLWKNGEDKVWIQHQGGEGMQTDTAKVEKLIEAFYAKEF